MEAFCDASIGAVLYDMVLAEDKSRGLDKPKPYGSPLTPASEATRDPDATVINPSDPEGKQQAVHEAESFSDYLARRDGAAASVSAPMPTPAYVSQPAAAPTPAAYVPPPAAPAYVPPPAPVAVAPAEGHTGAGKGLGGGEATRDPDATVINPDDPKGKQQAIHKAESFAEYLARR